MFSAATGPEKQSEPWMAGASIERVDGSIYASALLKSWTEESERAETMEGGSFGEAQAVEHQQRSLAAFTASVRDALLRLDRSADIHDIRFGAQNDNWESAWDTRSGVPLLDYKKRLDSLPVYAATADPSSGLNRSPSSAVDAPDDVNRLTSPGHGSLRGRFGGDLPAAVNYTRKIGQWYVASYPGSDNIWNNIPLHRQLRELENGQLKRTFANLDSICTEVRFRRNLMTIATYALMSAGIALPEDKKIEHFSVAEFEARLRKNVNNLADRKYRHAAKLIHDNILPEPMGSEGRKWIEPHRYIAAAIAMDGRIDAEDKCAKAIAKLEERTCYRDSGYKFTVWRLTWNSAHKASPLDQVTLGSERRCS